MRRGDIVIVSAPGDYGKPRPAVVIQSDRATETESVLICLMTSDVRAVGHFRIPIRPKAGNGLREETEIMVDKIMSLRRAKCGRPIGSLDTDEIIALNEALSVMIGLADEVD